MFRSGLPGIIAMLIFGSGRRNTTGSLFRWGRGSIAIGFLLLALAVLTAACGSSSDEEAAPGGGAGGAAPVPSSGWTGRCWVGAELPDSGGVGSPRSAANPGTSDGSHATVRCGGGFLSGSSVFDTLVHSREAVLETNVPRCRNRGQMLRGTCLGSPPVFLWSYGFTTSLSCSRPSCVRWVLFAAGGSADGASRRARNDAGRVPGRGRRNRLRAFG